jgi:hypothetical protein
VAKWVDTSPDLGFGIKPRGSYGTTKTNTSLPPCKVTKIAGDRLEKAQLVKQPPVFTGHRSKQSVDWEGLGKELISLGYNQMSKVSTSERQGICVLYNVQFNQLQSKIKTISITAENEMSEGHGHVTSCLVHDHASLGTDTNWNISGDILRNARLWLQHVRTTNYQKVLDQGRIPRQNPMSVEDAFLLATRQGGQALHCDDIGVLRVGARADLVCFDGMSPNIIGWTNAIAAVVLHSNIGDIKHVLVDGEFRKRDGNLVTLSQSWDEIRTYFADVARRIQGENSSPPAIPDKFWGGGEHGDVEIASVRT